MQMFLLVEKGEKALTDEKLLGDAIEKSGLKITYIAQALNLSREGFYKKINNQTEFKASEILKLQKLLNLTNKRREEIFFNTKVE